MPIVLAPLVPIALRAAVIALLAFAAKRALARRSFTGRTDQRGEDALDNLDEGLAVHRVPVPDGDKQTNAALRAKRVIRWGKGAIELDAALLGRFRVRKL